MKWSLTRLKPMEIIKPSDPNSVVAVAITGGGRLLEVPTVRLSLGKSWFFCLDGRLRKVVTHRLDCTIYSLESAL